MSKKSNGPVNLKQAAQAVFMHMHEQDYPALFDYEEDEQSIVVRNILSDALSSQHGPLAFEPEDIETITKNVIAMQKDLIREATLRQSEFYSHDETHIDPRLLALDTDNNGCTPN